MMTALVLVVLCRHDCLCVIGGVPCRAWLQCADMCVYIPCIWYVYAPMMHRGQSHNTVHLQLRAWCTTHAYAATQHNASGALHL